MALSSSIINYITSIILFQKFSSKLEIKHIGLWDKKVGDFLHRCRRFCLIPTFSNFNYIENEGCAKNDVTFVL